uniref:Uncharacterized protein n=1 Tax=Opuntia streptacantha TaxID=393608 RepID=A0A7C9E5B5_OPUST
MMLCRKKKAIRRRVIQVKRKMKLKKSQQAQRVPPRINLGLKVIKNLQILRKLTQRIKALQSLPRKLLLPQKSLRLLPKLLRHLLKQRNLQRRSRRLTGKRKKRSLLLWRTSLQARSRQASQLLSLQPKVRERQVKKLK